MARQLRRIRLLEREMAERKRRRPWRVPEIFEQQEGETLEAFEARVEREAAEMEKRNPKRGVMPVLFVYDDGTESQYEMVETPGLITFRKKQEA